MTRTRATTCWPSVALLLLLATPVPLAAQWASLGDMPVPRREGATLTFHNRQAIVSVSAIGPEVVRVRFAPGATLGRDHSYAVITRDLGDPGATIQVRAQETTIGTRSLQVTIRHRPFRMAIADAAGNSLDEDDPAMGLAFSGPTTRVFKRLREDEQVYGFGEKAGRLNKRGKQLGGYDYTMWNTDAYGYDPGIDPLYASFPFFMVLRNGRTHGWFVDNTFRTNFDIGKASQRLLSFGAEDGTLDYYFIDGPDPKQVIERYTALTGRMPLPPLWALGFHQCRYSYYPDARVRFIASNFRERKIPADVLWLDIHHLDGYNPLTWDKRRFPDPAGLVRNLRAQGFRLITIVDPHPKADPGWDVYDSGLAGGHFVKWADGSLYTAPVWPSNAERDPAPSVFPDFTRPATRSWWGSLLSRLTDLGVAGIWNDMNEPAVFVGPTWTFDVRVRHDNEGQPTDHREIHNVYGMQMTRATYDGLRSLRPDDRPFVLTRATFAGGQRYAALWAGDNLSRWEDLRHSLPLLSGLGLSGMPFVGVDIGGFGEAPTPELFTRWLQAGVFYPFMRVHSAVDTPDQEPWSFGVDYEALSRDAIELRYELLPHIYNVMRDAATTGVPAMRPLVLEFPSDGKTWSLDDEFMFGSDLLIAPVLHEARKTREVYLPAGAWFDFWTGTRYTGGSTMTVPVALQSIPIFVREGAFVFGQPVVQHTGEMAGQPLRISVFPGNRSESQLYEDDGESFAYQQDGYALRTFGQVRSTDARHRDTSVTITVSAARGRYRPPTPRNLEWLVSWSGDEPARVAITDAQENTFAVPRVALQETALRGPAWTMDAQRRVLIVVADRFDGMRITIDGTR